MKTDYDIIITGSGSGSGVLWHNVALLEKSILIREAGRWLKRAPELEIRRKLSRRIANLHRCP